MSSVAQAIQKRARFFAFVESLEDINLPVTDGLETINSLITDEEMRALPDLLKELEHWTAAARALAKFNMVAGAIAYPYTKQQIGDVYAQYFMRTDALATPRYNICIAIMKFATHQTSHALGQTMDVPYPNADGTRDYLTPGPAIETAYFGHSNLEEELSNAWRPFLHETAARHSFDLNAAL